MAAGRRGRVGGIGRRRVRGHERRTHPDGPPLDVPSPPAPVPAAGEAGIDGGRDASAAKPAPPAAGPGRPRRSTPLPATKPAAVRKADAPDKTELPPAAPVKPAADAPAPPPPSLQSTANVEELEQNPAGARACDARPREEIDARTLGADARAQFDEARRFAEQANAALKSNTWFCHLLVRLVFVHKLTAFTALNRDEIEI